MEPKLWYTSKTLWVNVVAVVGGFVCKKIGVDFTPEISLGILGGINILLRLITKKEVIWEK